MKFDKMRCIYLGFSFLCSIAAFVWGQPFISGNNQAANVIVTVFSVLAGFLVGLMGLVADPTLVAQRGSWRFTELHRGLVKQRLVRHRWTFELYLLTLALIFVTSLLKNYTCLTHLLERIWLAMAVFAFLISFSLPWSISRLQMERYDQLIDEQRKQANIKPCASSAANTNN